MGANKMNYITPPEQKSQKRIGWLDVSRGLAFLMVIYSHLEYCNDNVMRYFSPVFLTTFFFVSGYLFKEKCSFGKVLEQRTRTLLIPFLILGMTMILLSQIVTFNEKVALGDEIKGLIFQNGENQLLWFIAALYVYSIIFYWIERFSKGPNALLVICIILFVLNKVAETAGLPNIPWHIGSFGYACFYMGLGKFYKEKEEMINKITDKKWIAAASIFIYSVLITVYDLRISFGGGRFVLDALSVTIPGLIVMIYISKHFAGNCKFLLFVGANTLFYFAFHGKVYSLLQTICHKTIPAEILCINGIHDAIAFCIVFLDAMILILPAIFINRHFAYVLGKGYRLWNR